MNLGESAFSTVTLSDTPDPIGLVGAIAVELFTGPAVATELLVDIGITVQMITQPEQ